MKRWLRRLLRRKPPEGSIGAANREISANIKRVQAKLDDLDRAMTRAALRERKG